MNTYSFWHEMGILFDVQQVPMHVWQFCIICCLGNYRICFAIRGYQRLSNASRVRLQRQPCMKAIFLISHLLFQTIASERAGKQQQQQFQTEPSLFIEQVFIDSMRTEKASIFSSVLLALEQKTNGKWTVECKIFRLHEIIISENITISLLL